MKHKKNAGLVATLALPQGLPCSDASFAQLGKVSHGLDSDSAVERLKAEASTPRSEDKTPCTYPFHLTTTIHEALDQAFQHAFTTLTSSESESLVRQAQETARACMAEVFAGNEMMRLTPDAMREIEQNIHELAHSVMREAIKLENAACKNIPKSEAKSPELRRKLRDQLASANPVQRFKEKHLGFVAALEKQREMEQQSGKHTQ